MNLLDICCYNVKEVFGCCYNVKEVFG